MSSVISSTTVARGVILCALLMLTIASDSFAEEDAPPASETTTPASESEREDGGRFGPRGPRESFNREGGWREFRRRDWQRGPREGETDRRQWDRSDRRRGWRRSPEGFAWHSGPISSGFVFLNGQYLQPPYALHLVEQRLTLNGRQFTPAKWLPDQNVSSLNGLQAFDRLRQELQNGGIVVIQDADTPQGQAVLSLLPRTGTGYKFLQHLAGDLSASELPETLPREVEQWLVTFAPSPELVARAKQEVQLIQDSLKGTVEDAPSVGAWAYPLTTLGMFLAAVAVGQLFVSRSLLSQPVENDSSEISQAAARCIMFIVALSLLDLVWTLMALRSDVMYELNPLATHLLSSPLGLAGFKIVITGCGAASLYFLREHRPARLAAWWLCLVCTLVTVRWVAFTSLFVT